MSQQPAHDPAAPAPPDASVERIKSSRPYRELPRSPELARQAKALQPELAVSKPYGREQLARKVRHLLAKRSLPAPAPAGAAPETQTVRVLVAEDDLDLLDVACRLFHALGQETHGAATVEDALAVLESQPAAGAVGFGFDVVAKPYRLDDLRAMPRRLT